MWRIGNPSALLVGMQTCAGNVENSMEFPQKTKNGTRDMETWNRLIAIGREGKNRGRKGNALVQEHV